MGRKRDWKISRVYPLEISMSADTCFFNTLKVKIRFAEVIPTAPIATLFGCSRSIRKHRAAKACNVSGGAIASCSWILEERDYRNSPKDEKRESKQLLAVRKKMIFWEQPPQCRCPLCNTDRKQLLWKLGWNLRFTYLRLTSVSSSALKLK